MNYWANYVNNGEWRIKKATMKASIPLNIFDSLEKARKHILHRLQMDIEYLQSEIERLKSLPDSYFEKD